MACGVFYFHVVACKLESTVKVIKDIILRHLLYYLLTVVEVILLVGVSNTDESVMGAPGFFRGNPHRPA